MAEQEPPRHPRCGVCGVEHPHLSICPFIAEQEVSQHWEGQGKARKLVTTVMRTRYYERPHLFEALVAAQEEELEQ